MLQADTKVWKCGKFNLSLDRPRVMGILNVTPDSFSDGGQHLHVQDAIAYGYQLLDQGADILDIGGESTRPGSQAVSAQEELRRIAPVVQEFVAAGAIVSVDTRHAEVARACVDMGAAIINDVDGFSHPDMVDVAANSECGCLIMHANEGFIATDRKQVHIDGTEMSSEEIAQAEQEIQNPYGQQALLRNTPEQSVEQGRLKNLPHPDKPAQPSIPAEFTNDIGTIRARAASAVGRDPWAAQHSLQTGNPRRYLMPDQAPLMRRILGFLGDQARILMRAGVDHNRICIDPGSGFGKTYDENIVIQRQVQRIASLGYPVACAVSRKRFVGACAGIARPSDRDVASIGFALSAVQAGARILRVHDVKNTVDALNTFWIASQEQTKKALIGLGSNVDDRMGYLSKAISAINSLPATCVSAVSHAYETEPAYGLNASAYNCCIEIKTQLAPMVLLDALLQIETDLGRTRSHGVHGHAPRTIDCDLLWMENEYHAGQRLQVPYMVSGEREFVMRPLQDIVKNPERLFQSAGVIVKPQSQRVGKIIADMGEITWE